MPTQSDKNRPKHHQQKLSNQPLNDQPMPSHLKLKSPREVFMMWLLQLPEEANQSVAARQAIARIDASSISNNDTLELRDLLAQVVNEA